MWCSPISNTALLPNESFQHATTIPDDTETRMKLTRLHKYVPNLNEQAVDGLSARMQFPLRPLSALAEVTRQR